MSALFRETLLLPLVVCVVLPSMAGAWWRHTHADPAVQPPAVSVTFVSATVGSTGADTAQSCGAPAVSSKRGKSTNAVLAARSQ
jgi:hypothetical protein